MYVNELANGLKIGAPGFTMWESAAHRETVLSGALQLGWSPFDAEPN